MKGAHPDIRPRKTGLSPDQWAVCIVVALSLIVVEEVRKVLKVRTGDEPAPTQTAPVSAAA